MAGERLVHHLAPSDHRRARRRTLLGVHGVSPNTGGHLKRPSSTSGAAARTSSAIEAGTDLVVPHHVHEWVRMGGGRDVVDRAPHVGGVVEDGTQLIGELIELVVGQLEAGQVGDVSDVVTGDPGHRRMVGGVSR